MKPKAVPPAGSALIAPAGGALSAWLTGLNAAGLPASPPIRLGMEREAAGGKATSGRATLTCAALVVTRVAIGGGLIVAVRLAVCTRYSNWRVPWTAAGGAALKFNFRLAWTVSTT